MRPAAPWFGCLLVVAGCRSAAPELAAPGPAAPAPVVTARAEAAADVGDEAPWTEVHLLEGVSLGALLGDRLWEALSPQGVLDYDEAARALIVTDTRAAQQRVAARVEQARLEAPHAQRFSRAD